MHVEMSLQERMDRLIRDAVGQSDRRIGVLLMFALDEINLDTHRETQD